MLSSALGTTAILPFPDENKMRCITIPKSQPLPTHAKTRGDTTPIVDEFKGLDMDISGPSSFCSRRAFLRQYWSENAREGVLLHYAFRHAFSDPLCVPGGGGGLKVVLDGVKVAFAHLGGALTPMGTGVEDPHLHDAIPELDEYTGRVVICTPGRRFGTSSVQVLDFSVYYRRFL